MNDKPRRGFVTIATGKVFYPMAKHLFITYKLNSGCDDPFYCLTDAKGMKELEGYFDKLIEIKDPTYSYLDKLKLAEYACFENNIFIDADSSVIDGLSYFWDLLEDLDYPVTAIGGNYLVSDKEHHPIFDKSLLIKNGIDSYVTFNGGVYIFKDCEESRKIFDFAVNAVDLYKEYDMPMYNRGIGDEPLLQLAMSLNGCKVVDMKDSRDFSVCLVSYSDLKVDVVYRKCSLFKGWQRHPKILHWGTELAQISPAYGKSYKMAQKVYNPKLSFFDYTVIYTRSFYKKLKYKMKSLF